SPVLSRAPDCWAAYWLHSSIAACIVGRLAGAAVARGTEACGCEPWRDVAGDAAGDCAIFLSSARRSSALSADVRVQLATTRPVTTAVAMMRAMPIAVSFQGFQWFSDIRASS